MYTHTVYTHIPWHWRQEKLHISLNANTTLCMYPNPVHWVFSWFVTKYSLNSVIQTDYHGASIFRDPSGIVAIAVDRITALSSTCKMHWCCNRNLHSPSRTVVTVSVWELEIYNLIYFETPLYQGWLLIYENPYYLFKLGTLLLCTLGTTRVFCSLFWMRLVSGVWVADTSTFEGPWHITQELFWRGKYCHCAKEQPSSNIYSSI